MTSTDHAHAHRHSLDASTLLATLLDLDAQVHERVLDDALDALREHIDFDEVRRVMDVGAGTGAATIRLSDRYRNAEVIALDTSADRSRQITERAEREGRARVRVLNRPVLASGLPAGSVDLVWASSVFHEFDDPAAVLAELSTLIRPGGVLAIMEMDAPPRVLPDRYHDLEQRLRQLAHADAHQPEWTDAVLAAGYERLEKRTLSSDQQLPAQGIGGDYARAELQRLALHTIDDLTAADRTALSRVLDAGSAHPEPVDVHIRGTRSLWIARRP